MPAVSLTRLEIKVYVVDGGFVFDPPLREHGYQFSKHAQRGTIVFQLMTKDYAFCGCSFHPISGGMPGMAARWNTSARGTDELVATLVFPEGVIQEGDLHLYCIHVSGTVHLIDPQVGNDGETGDGTPPGRAPD